jgi:hypothetical protein
MAAGSAGNKTDKLTWWVGEQFNPDGSATYAEISKSGGGHPDPGPNQIIYGPYPTAAAAKAAENRAGQLAAKQIYRGSNVDKGPGGFNIPKDQAPPIPNPFSWLGVLAHWVGDFVKHVTDLPMWISLGWIALGLLLVSLGINLWLKLPQKLLKAAEAAAI